jgi:LmbE family N-acetylglucosaminyl deacetylase
VADIYIPSSAMAVVAHPDDIEFSCAGTLARWARSGARISYVLCTSGEVGIAEPGMTKEKATGIREAEQREAAQIAGAQEVIFLREPDVVITTDPGAAQENCKGDPPLQAGGGRLR